MLCTAETSPSHYLPHLNTNISQLQIDHLLKMSLLVYDTNNCLRQSILKPGITCTSSEHTSGRLALSICTFIYIYIFHLKLLFKLFFITEYAKEYVFPFPPFFLSSICIMTEYAEIVPTVNKVNAEQYKMKLIQKNYKFSGFVPRAKLRLKTTP